MNNENECPACYMTGFAEQVVVDKKKKIAKMKCPLCSKRWEIDLDKVGQSDV